MENCPRSPAPRHLEVLRSIAVSGLSSIAVTDSYPVTRGPTAADQALAQLRRIQRHSLSINRAAPATGMSTINSQQASVLAALNVKKPAVDAQMSLL